MTTTNVDREWLQEQVRSYASVFPRYKQYSKVLYDVLRTAVTGLSPLAIVQSRPKAISSFAEKALRKGHLFKDPLHDFTDLCGARVIVPTRDDLAPVCDFIKAHFNVDWDNSVDVGALLKTTEFGYRSIHYIVSFLPESFPTRHVDVAIPDSVLPDEECPMKAEIQVRTLLEHTWSEFAHDRSYKSRFELPSNLQRELAVVAALLESADSSLRRINSTLERYSSSYEAYMSADEINDEIALLEMILEHSPADYKTAHKIGKLAISIGDWRKAIDVLSGYTESAYQPILRDVGVALCRKNSDSPDSAEYKSGQEYLERAIDACETDTDAIASLAGTWKGTDDEKAWKLYKQAYEIDPGDPYVLGNCLEYEISSRKDASIIPLMAHSIQAAIDRCKEQAQVGVNYPWAFYDLGKFHMLLGQPYMSLYAYLRAIELTTAQFMIESSLQSLITLKPAFEAIHGFEWAVSLLKLGRAAGFPDGQSAKILKSLISRQYKKIEGAVVLIVGPSERESDVKMQSNPDLLVDAFKDYSGTVISGGTDTGIGRLVGDLQQAYPTRIHSIGYTPDKLPPDVKVDRRYLEIRTTTGSQFSPLQPIQYWIDILASGIDPSSVKVMGMGGNAIALFEHILALTLGATVAVPRQFDDYLKLEGEDILRSTLRKVAVLPDDPYVLRAYVGTGLPRLPARIRESIAEALHESYRKNVPHQMEVSPESLADWDELPRRLKESNLQVVDHIVQKLNEIGCVLDTVENGGLPEFSFTDEEIEVMAEMEHARWVAERILQGWKYAPKKSFAEKTNPFLLPWDKLNDDMKELDRELTRNLPSFLADFDLGIRRK